MSNDLSIMALEKATNNWKMQKGIVFHFDRIRKYTSNKYELKLKKLGIIPKSF